MKKIVTLLFALATVITIFGEVHPSINDQPVIIEITSNIFPGFPEWGQQTTEANITLEKQMTVIDETPYMFDYKLYKDSLGERYWAATLYQAVSTTIKFDNNNIQYNGEYVEYHGNYPILRIDGYTNPLPANSTLDLTSSNIKIISDNAFQDCKNLTSIVFSESLTQIGIYAFYHSGLSGTLTIPGNIKNIPNGAFYYCSSLSDIIIEEGVTSIGAWTFANCGYINNLTLPNTIKIIGSERVFQPEDTTSQSKHGAFADTYIKNVYINTTTPPQMILATEETNQQFNDWTLQNGNFYIPCGEDTKQAYSNADGWNEIPADHYFSKEQEKITLYVQPDIENFATTYFFANCMDNGQYTYTIEVELTDEYKDSGYKFLGWFTSENADQPLYQDMKTTVNPDEDGRVFYARFAEPAKEGYAWRWDADKVYVLCDNGGNSSFGNNIHETTYSATAGQSITLTDYPNGEISLTVPMIVTETQNLSGIINQMNGTNNIVVCNGATLTIDQSLPSNTTITVNETGKLNVTQSVSLDTLVLWANPYENKAAEVIGLNNISNRSTYFDCLLKHDYAVVSFPTTVLFDDITYYDRPNEVSLGAYCYDQTQLGKAVAWENKSIQQRYSFEAGKGYLLWSNDPINTNFERIRFKLQSNISSSRSYSPTLDSGYEEEKFRNWTFTGTLATSTLSQGQGSNIFDNVQEGYVFDDISNAKLIDLENLLPYKGYLIQVPNNFTVTYNESQTPYKMRRVQETASYKTGIILTQESYSDRIIFRIGEEYTPAYDLGSDLAKMFTGKEDLTTYTLLNSTPLAVNATTPELAQLSLPLGFRTVNTDSPLTFSLDSRYNADNISALYLHDNITNTTVNLLAEDYTFTTDLTQDDSRFTLALITQANEDVATALPHNADNPLYAYAADGTLLVAGFSETADVSVFDISGRLITNANGCNTTARFSLPAGHYIVNVKQGAQTTILRAIVH